MDFVESARLLDSVGVGYRQAQEHRDFPNGDPTDLPSFTVIFFPFSAEEWCSMLMRDAGNYLSGADRAYSLWAGAFRDSGSMSAWDLGELAALLAREGMEFFEKDLSDDRLRFWIENFRTLRPWKKVGVIWQIVRPHHRPKTPEAGRRWMKPVERSVRTLGRALESLDTHKLFAHWPADPAQADDSEDRKRFRRCKEGQGKAYELITLARIIPSLTDVYRNVEELAPPPLVGWAIWDNGAKDIASNGLGACIFEERADVDALFEQWRKDEAMYEKPMPGTAGIPIDERLRIRPVRVTFQRGVEFLDEETPDAPEKGPRDDIY